MTARAHEATREGLPGDHCWCEHPTWEPGHYWHPVACPTVPAPPPI